MLTTSEKLAWTRETLRVLSSLSELPSDEMDYRVYEILDADVRAAFCTDNLNEIASTGRISREAVTEIEAVRDTTLPLIDRRLPGTEIARHSDWQQVISQARATLESLSK